ncbi:MAG TPA: flagellar motor protein [Terriglobales bacterium]|nr:flagellar motor protein [Terriglobales bacterium]
MDRSSSIGLLVAIGGIVTGLMMDGGNLAQILQPTAALIVFGGTLGAIMLQFPLDVVVRAFKEAKMVFLFTEPDFKALVEQIVGFAHKARKEGIVSLDKDLETIEAPFLRKAMMLAVDGTQANELRNNMEVEMGNHSEQAEKVVQVFEAAGGFSPTIGIIGAILGLIQVMQHLDNITEVGRGIAVAFVATIYGVAIANLAFLPMAGKMRYRRRQNDLKRELMLEGVVGILEGMNPRMLQTRLSGYLSPADEKKAVASKAPGKEEAAPEVARAARG